LGGRVVEGGKIKKNQKNKIERSFYFLDCTNVQAPRKGVACSGGDKKRKTGKGAEIPKKRSRTWGAAKQGCSAPGCASPHVGPPRRLKR
jgi:hypothetical protein